MSDITATSATGEASNEATLALASLARQFPALPRVVLDDLLAHCDSAQWSRLREGRVPLAVAELAAHELRQLRVGLACESLHDGWPTTDRDAILVGLLPRLHGWPANMALELRRNGPTGPLLRRIGPAQAPAYIIADEGGIYRAYGHAPPNFVQVGTLEHAVRDLLHGQGAALSQRLGSDAAFRESLVALALDHSRQLPELLGMVGDTRRFFRPPSRFADGRLGYALSGRGGGLPTTPPTGIIARLLRGLYPEADASTLQILANEVGSGVGALEEIARRRSQFVQLRTQLNDWLRHPGGNLGQQRATRPARELIVRVMLQAWQRRFVSNRATASDGAVQYTLCLSYLRTRTPLPVANVTFPHILELELIGMGLERVSTGFLEMFPNARILHLDENPLRELPLVPALQQRLREAHLRHIGPLGSSQVLDWLQPAAGVLQRLDLSNNPTIPTEPLLTRLPQFSQLRSLQLDYNGIVLNAATQNAFSSLAQLEVLSLDGNPLRLPPNVQNLERLRQLSLASTRLHTLPPGLDVLLAQVDLRLNYVDLGGNAIRQLPDLRGSEFFRRASQDGVNRREVYLNLDGNPLNAEAVAMLDQAELEFEPGLEHVDSEPEPAADPEPWLVGCPQPLLDSIRSARQAPEAAAFYQVLSEVVRTAPYVRSRSPEQRLEVTRRAWALAERFLLPGEHALPGLTELRDRLYDLATDARGTCGDGVVLTLDQFEAEVSVWQVIAQTPGADQTAPLRAALVPARRLYRQALLDAQAQRLTRARAARLAGVQAADPAADLADDVSAEQLQMGTDEVELRLLLRQRLELQLDLPAVSERLYASVVGQATVSRIADRVRALDTDEGFGQWLMAHQHTWRQALERNYQMEFEQVRAPYNEALAYVLARAEGQAANEPPTAAALALLRQVEPALRWQTESGAPVHPALSEQQAYSLSNRLAERCLVAVDALGVSLALKLMS